MRVPVRTLMIAQLDKPGRKQRKLEEEERVLWEQITRAVRPLARGARSPEAESGALPATAQTEARATLQKLTGSPEPQSQSEPLDRRYKQRLARGHEPIDARLDLHGRTQAQAYAALLRFVRRAQDDGARFVLVITGKGSVGGVGRSERGVLNRQVPLWLALPQFRHHVSAFGPAHLRHGGEGALYVRLRRQRPRT
jgi:DNA-nicking Smr family endonuclease